MSLFVVISIVLAIAGVMMVALTLLSSSRYGASHQLRDAKDHNLSPARFWRTALLNVVTSVILVYGYTALVGGRIVHDRPVGALRSLGEGAAVLLLFDFLYYLVHRYPFHEWKVLRGVHAVHHIVRNPIAVDSLFQHPLENFLGLTLFWVCALLVTVVTGPLGMWSFGWAFLVYSTLNVVVHAGMDFRVPGLGLVTYLGTRHNKHHVSMTGKNYASVTPLWDHVFGTEEP